MKSASLKEVLELHEAGKLVGTFNLTNEVYHSSPGLSKTALDRIDESPAHYLWSLQNPEGWTTAKIFGSGYHAKMLEPHLFDDLFYIRDTQPVKPKPDDRGRLPLSVENLEKIEGMVQKALEDIRVQKILKSGFKEISFFWTDPQTGILCKTKPDIIMPNGMLMDFKTAASIKKKTFAAAAADRRYHVQAAYAIRGVALAIEQSGENPLGIQYMPNSFTLIAQKKSDEFDVALYPLGPNSLVLGEVEMDANLATYARCYHRNLWHGVQEVAEELDVPSWRFKEKGLSYEQ